MDQAKFQRTAVIAGTLVGLSITVPALFFAVEVIEQWFAAEAALNERAPRILARVEPVTPRRPRPSRTFATNVPDLDEPLPGRVEVRGWRWGDRFAHESGTLWLSAPGADPEVSTIPVSAGEFVVPVGSPREFTVIAAKLGGRNGQLVDQRRDVDYFVTARWVPTHWITATDAVTGEPLKILWSSSDLSWQAAALSEVQELALPIGEPARESYSVTISSPGYASRELQLALHCEREVSLELERAGQLEVELRVPGGSRSRVLEGTRLELRLLRWRGPRTQEVLRSIHFIPSDLVHRWLHLTIDLPQGEYVGEVRVAGRPVEIGTFTIEPDRVSRLVEKTARWW